MKTIINYIKESKNLHTLFGANKTCKDVYISDEEINKLIEEPIQLYYCKFGVMTWSSIDWKNTDITEKRKLVNDIVKLVKIINKSKKIITSVNFTPHRTFIGNSDIYFCTIKYHNNKYIINDEFNANEKREKGRKIIEDNLDKIN